MAYDGRAVANTILGFAERDGVPVTPMQLVKLVYIAHGWHLALSGSKPLVRQPIEAWKYGPVVADVYHAFKRFGRNQITEPYQDVCGEGNRFFFQTPTIPECPQKALVHQVWNKYKHKTGPELMALTHRLDTPWQEVWNNRGGSSRPGTQIPDDLICKHFSSKRRSAQSGG